MKHLNGSCFQHSITDIPHFEKLKKSFLEGGGKSVAHKFELVSFSSLLYSLIEQLMAL
jgi:hypothetical protein